MKKAPMLLAIVALAANAVSAQAAYILSVQEEAGGVVATGAGSLNVSSLTDTLAGRVAAVYVNAGNGEIRTGLPTSTPPAAFNAYFGIIGPVSFGSGGFFAPTSTAGDFVGVVGSLLDRGPGLYVPGGYVSGAALSSSALWSGATFASLGLTTGTYVWRWPAGQPSDTFTLQIGRASVPEPGTLLLMALGLGMLGFLRASRRKGQHSGS